MLESRLWHATQSTALLQLTQNMTMHVSKQSAYTNSRRAIAAAFDPGSGARPTVAVRETARFVVF